METSNGSTYISRTWSRQKFGNTADQNEDACRIAPYRTTEGADGLFVALSDGATEAIYSRQWAQALVAAAEPDWPGLSDEELANRLSSLRKSFSPFPPGKDIPWFARDKFRLQGSQATLLVASIEPNGSGYSIKALAVGDSGLFLFRKSGTIAAFPALKSADVGVNPALITSLARPATRVERWSGRMEAGDLFVLATDAVEKWLLELLEEDRGEEFLGFLSGLWAEDTALAQDSGPTTQPAGNGDRATERPGPGTTQGSSGGRLLVGIQAGDSSWQAGFESAPIITPSASGEQGTPLRAASNSPDFGTRGAEAETSQRKGIFWLLERMHILPTDAAAEICDSRAVESTATGGGSEVRVDRTTLNVSDGERQPAPLLEENGSEATLRDPASDGVQRSDAAEVAVDRSDAFDGLLAKYREGGAAPRMRNDDVTLAIVVPEAAGDLQSRRASIAGVFRMPLTAPQSPAALVAPPPPQPTNPHTLTRFGRPITDMLGQRAREVYALLGEPERKVREVQPEGWPGFGPHPSWIAANTKFETWTYLNVNGNTWCLYIAAPPDAAQALEARLKGVGRPETDPLWEIARALRAGGSEPAVADFSLAPPGVIL